MSRCRRLTNILRLRMRGELRRIQRELGITFIHVTHTQLEATAVADVVVVMDQGRIEQAAPARDIFLTRATPMSRASSAARTCCPVRSSVWPTDAPCR